MNSKHRVREETNQHGKLLYREIMVGVLMKKWVPALMQQGGCPDAH